MAGQTERGLGNAPIKQTPKGAVANLISIPGLKMYMYPDGHMNLAGKEGGYPFDSFAEFIGELGHLAERLRREVSRGRGVAS
jgi:hypothetical protein